MLSALKIKKPNQVKEGIHAILYGDPKSGKTSTLDDPNMKVLLLDIEGGSAVLAGAENVDIVPIEKLEDLQEVAKLLKKGVFIDEEGNEVPFNYGLVAIDSLTRLQDLVKDYIVRVYAPNRKREIQGKFGAQSDWGDFGLIIKDMVKFFHTLTKQGEKSINVMWIAHKENVKDDITGGIVGTKIQMQGSSANEIMSVVDAIFYMVKKDTEQGLKFGVATRKMGAIEAGVRQSKKEERLPDIIENPVWSEIFTKLGYKVALK